MYACVRVRACVCVCERNTDACNSFVMGRGDCNCCGIVVVCFMLNIYVKCWERFNAL